MKDRKSNETDIREKENLERRRAEAEAARIKAEIENKKREEYVKKLNEERLALLKAKQGITDVDIEEIIREEKMPDEKLTFSQKVSSFIYLNKWWLGIAACCAVVFGIIVFDLLTRKNPDLTILLLTDEISYYSKSSEISKVFGEYVGDVNGDGKVIVDINYIPISGRDDENPTEVQGDPYMLNQQKLYTEMQTGIGVIVIADSNADEYLDPENTLLNLDELFPENEHVNKYGFYIKGTDFAKKISDDNGISDNVYIGIREPKAGMDNEKRIRKNFDIAYSALEKLIKDMS